MALVLSEINRNTADGMFGCDQRRSKNKNAHRAYGRERGRETARETEKGDLDVYERK